MSLNWNREDKYFLDIRPFENKDYRVTATIINGTFIDLTLLNGNSFRINGTGSLKILKELIDEIYSRSTLGITEPSDITDGRLVDIK